MSRKPEDLSGWTGRPRPPREPMEGRLVRLEPFDADAHARDLFEAYRLDADGTLWTYLPYGPFADLDAYRAHARTVMTSDDPLFHSIIDLSTGKAAGVASLMRIVPEHGVIETGHICYSPLLQRTVGATEAMYLLACRVFDDLGYRRYEWKCDNGNAPSRRAAARLGFRFEGVFRKHLVVKGRNRDTAWFSITDDEWPSVKAAYRRFLDGGNFGIDGSQQWRLSTLNAASLQSGVHALRRADLADLDAVEALQQAAYAGNGQILGVTPIPLQWDYRAVFADAEVWLLEEGEDLAGVLIVTPHRDHLYVDSIGVAPDRMGKGAGNALLSAAESRARSLELPELRLITGEKLVSNVDWYRRKGFGIAEIEAMPDRRAVHLSKRLG
ncbi:GNAT family N-acetyltransferase [Microbaculum marinum]|uniref:GNAT family N-acetyltransferase n=1 Tax=Microbaculum marinum TaxID=1764581 RepID=A0AAW9RZ45_9HYPH